MTYTTSKRFISNTALLVLLISLTAFYSKVTFAWNPDITQVVTWHLTSKDAKYGAWVSQPKSSGKGYLFNKKQRNNLQNWYKKQKWSKIQNFIDNHGGPTIVTPPSPQPTTPALTALSQTPLFLSAGVAPNINFILDDSGSMKWEAMIDDKTSDLAPKAGLPVLRSSNGSYKQAAYLVPKWIPSFYAPYNNAIPPVAVDSRAWMAKNTIANPLYYDSTSTYYPWPGTDSNGNPLYKDADPLKAKQSPNLSNSKTIDLTKNQTYNYLGIPFTLFIPVFYTWEDTNDNGIVDNSDAHTRVEIKPGNESLFTNGRSYAQELQNFANWFQYYRSRESGAKVAIGTVMSGTSGTRMGLELINKGHIDDVADMDKSANKVGLINNLYDISSGGGTPLRKALQSSGKMFQGKTSTPSPILSYSEGGSCQQNFQVIMTDGYWNGGSPSVGNVDGDLTNTFSGSNYADNYSDTLADVAMYYYSKDLSGLANEVPTKEDVDENNAQHLVTYTIGFGVNGHIDPDLDPKKGEVSWSKPNTNGGKIDDLWHAAFNGRGEYLNAAYPEVLSNALNSIIEDIQERTANTSAVAINSAKLTTETALYVAEFNASRWQGEIYAYKIANLDTGELNENATWAAGATLTNRDLDDDPRVIITSDGNTGLPFQWGDLKNNQKNDFYTSPNGSTSLESTAQKRLAYIRGDRSNEGKELGFRTRSTLLGDVVNSGPVYVQQPDLTWPDFAPFPTASGSRYSDFVKANKDRKGVVYVGANDGMLHAFDASTDEDTTTNGREIFAYVPNILYSSNVNEGLHYLTDPNYGHIFYNDLTPSISDVYLKTKNNAGKQWSTLLIAGLRRGGRGIYALDITDPNNFKNESTAKDMALWEFSDQNDTDLGYTYSKPQIALGNNGKWLAIFGNGYNDLGSGESSLFIVDIEAASDGSWDSGDYIKLSTGSGSPTDKNGLSTPALADIDGNGTVDRIYAGDLKGQLWVFDLSSSANSAWKLANTTPLFTTKGARPITAQPALSFHPTIEDSASNIPNVLVFFGSGSYLTNADKKDTTSVNHFYGIWDSGTSNLNYNQLVEQTFDSSFTSSRVLTSNSVDYASKFGWYITLPDLGERSVTKAVVRFDVVFFNTFIPSSSPCSSEGFGYKMAVDSATGGALQEPVFDTNNDGVVDENDTISNSNDTATSTVAGLKQEDFLPEPVFIEDLMFTAKTATKVKAAPNKKSGRLSWQELIE